MTNSAPFPVASYSQISPTTVWCLFSLKNIALVCYLSLVRSVITILETSLATTWQRSDTDGVLSLHVWAVSSSSREETIGRSPVF